MKKITILTIALGLTISTFAQQWTALGSGSSSILSAIAVSGSNVYAGGNYTTSNGVTSFANFSSGTWNSLGTWVNFPNGIGATLCAATSGNDVYVGGSFTNAAADTNIDCIGRYNTVTQTWHSLGSGLNGMVNAIVVVGNDVYVGGRFTNAGGIANADYIARWDGTNWNALGTGTIASTSNFHGVNALATDGNIVYAGGYFGSEVLKQWDGVNFSTVGGGFGSSGAVFSLKVASNGDLYAAGEFPPNRVNKYNGVAWLGVGGGLNSGETVYSLEIFNGDVYIGGDFNNAGGDVNADYFAKLNGNSWEAAGGGLNAIVKRLVASGTDLYVGGNFTDAGGNINADRIAIWGAGSTSIDEIQEISTTVYPNPSKGIFNISTKSKMLDYELYNMLGEKLMSQNVQSNMATIDITNLTNGVYFIRVNGEIKKVIKE